MRRKDTVIMDGEDFDKIHLNLWLITDCIDSGRNKKTLAEEVRRCAQEALDVMDRDDDDPY